MDVAMRVAEIIGACRSVLSDEAIEGVDHYYEHGEPEMAFEGLLIELMKADAAPPTFDYDAWCALGRDCGLDEDCVFDAELWTKFLAWGKARHGQQGRG